MPTKASLPGWFHVTARGVLLGRSGPSTKSPVKYRRPTGYNLYLRRRVQANGRTWLVSRFNTYYAEEFLAPGRSESTRVESPVPGHRKGYAYGVKDRRYIAGFHTGQDWPASTGSRIVSVLDGTVIRTDWGGAYGNWTQIRCGSHVFMYAHQQRRTVRKGQRVKAGQTIGYVGTSGNVTGPHLHHEKSRGNVWIYGRVVNPTW